MKISELKFDRLIDPIERSDIEEHTLEVESWDHEEGFRIPKVRVNEDGYVIDGDRWLCGLMDLQEWVHDDDIEIVDQYDNILEPLRSLSVPIGDLNHDPKNARVHNAHNIKSVKNSLRKLGQHQPIVVQKEGMIVRVGNARLQSARELGWTHIAALIVDEDDVQATARAIADNRTSELATWDWDLLPDLLSAYESDDSLISITELGFSLNEFEDLKTYGKTEVENDIPSGIDPNEIGDYDPDQETYLIKIEKVAAADRDDVLQSIQDALKQGGFDYVANCY